MKFKKDFFLTDNIFSLVSNPFHITRRELYRSLRLLACEVSGEVLDVGCGTKPYQTLFNKSRSYTGLEYGETRTTSNSSADIFYQGDTFPLEDNMFDSVVTFQVLEHVPDNRKFLSEIHRVLKDNGTLLLTAPLCWGEHEQPYDFKRFTRFGLKREIEAAGFELTHISQLGNEPKVILQLTANLFSRVEGKLPGKLLQRVFRVLYCTPINILGSLFTSKEDPLYFDNIVVARKR